MEDTQATAKKPQVSPNERYWALYLPKELAQLAKDLAARDSRTPARVVADALALYSRAYTKPRVPPAAVDGIPRRGRPRKARVQVPPVEVAKG